MGCFKLAGVRNGEICNACVLIVKRWKKLPKDTDKDWHHVVDARTGPGIKNVFKNKKKDPVLGTPDKHVYKHKHVYRRRRKRAVPVKSASCCDKEQSYILDFIDTDYWRRYVTSRKYFQEVETIFPVLQRDCVLRRGVYRPAGGGDGGQEVLEAVLGGQEPGLPRPLPRLQLRGVQQLRQGDRHPRRGERGVLCRNTEAITCRHRG